MFPKPDFRLIVIAVMILGISSIAWALTPRPASAQCGSEPPPGSSCSTCHLDDDSFIESGSWHGIHARKDCCANCHGGNCLATQEEQAHQSMIPDPLSDIYTNCHSCHPADYQQRAELFVAELGLTPANVPTPTPVPVGKIMVDPLVILPSPVATTPITSHTAAMIAASLFLILFISGLAFYLVHKHAKS